MNQAEIIKGLLEQYRKEGGDLTNPEAASAYVTAHKPQGVGRTSAVVCAAIIKQLPPPPAPMIDQAPPPPPAPIVIATATAPVPETVEPFAVYREIEQSESTPVASVAERRETIPIPLPVPKEPEKKDLPPVEPAKTQPPVKSWIQKLKFWKK